MLLRSMEKYFKGYDIEFIKRSQNEEADELAKAAARKTPMPPDVFFITIEEPSLKDVERETQVVSAIISEDWRAPIMAYLRGHYEPENEVEQK